MARRKTLAYLQGRYMVAKAFLETLECKAAESERQYIADRGIKNPDGSMPERIYCIEDDAVFSEAIAEYCEIFDSSRLGRDIAETRELVKYLEKYLIEFGLKMAPAKQREVLERAVKKDAAIRQKLVDLVFRLDASTVKP
jgi:hypothetical protein